MLSQNLISKIKDGNETASLDYIGPALDIILERDGYDDLSFKISQSEILAALYAIDFGLRCEQRGALKFSHICKANTSNSPPN